MAVWPFPSVPWHLAQSFSYIALASCACTDNAEMATVAMINVISFFILVSIFQLSTHSGCGSSLSRERPTTYRAAFTLQFHRDRGLRAFPILAKAKHFLA